MKTMKKIIPTTISSAKRMFEEQLAKDSKKMASMTFDDLPTEDEWLMIQAQIKD